GRRGGGGGLNAGGAGGASQSGAVTLGPRIISTAFSGPSASSLNKIRVTFDQAVALSSFTNGDVTLRSPSGQTIPVNVKVVSGSGDKVFEMTFATQTKVGTYTLFVGPY